MPVQGSVACLCLCVCVSVCLSVRAAQVSWPHAKGAAARKAFFHLGHGWGRGGKSDFFILDPGRISGFRVCDVQETRLHLVTLARREELPSYTNQLEWAGGGVELYHGRAFTWEMLGMWVRTGTSEAVKRNVKSHLLQIQGGDLGLSGEDALKLFRPHLVKDTKGRGRGGGRKHRHSKIFLKS